MIVALDPTPRSNDWAKATTARSTPSPTGWRSWPARNAFVTWFDEDTPLQRILECRPDVLVKCDWPVDKIVGNVEVAGWGGRILQ